MSKTHEMCAKCRGWVALNKPHVTAYTEDGHKVWLHADYCASYYEVPVVDKQYVNYPDPAKVYGGGS